MSFIVFFEKCNFKLDCSHIFESDMLRGKASRTCAGVRNFCTSGEPFSAREVLRQLVKSGARSAERSSYLNRGQI